MSSTTVLAETLAKALAECDPNRIADALRAYGIGMALSPQKWTFNSSPGATTWVITGATAFAGASAGSKTPPLPQGQATLPPIMHVYSLRTLPGGSAPGVSGAVGLYNVADAGASATTPQLAGSSGAQFLAVPGTVLLSDDGTTLTFPVAVQGFVLEYVPRGVQDVTSNFEHS